ncbi:MAG: MSMEG_4193 family putative phosphomutase [Candidatus Nanopelagicales bacterium]|jgi:probable phosphomutase (TIGR03848 family)|nr:MSMEG_4193 family putative phosphomutase [Candidatus Nanopelagicales bacterium]MCU0301907.1 MSMEG_4193 family putative phosphomutase [Candidatus Nanopelagicales bacterium]
MTVVLLVRHGRTGANARGILAGRAPGVALDGTGRKQARALAGRLRAVPLTAVVHSPLERCAETAALMLDGRGEVPLHVDDRLVECDYGDWSGRPLAELAREPLWATVQAQPSAVRFPGGEAMLAMAKRAVASVGDWVRREPAGTVAMVTHGDVIKAILSDALGQPFDAFQRIAVSPGSVSVVAYPRDQRPVVLGINATAGRVRVPQAPAPTVGGGAA